MRAHRRFFVHLLLAVALLGAQSLAWVHGVLHMQHPHRHAEPHALAPVNAAEISNATPMTSVQTIEGSASSGAANAHGGVPGEGHALGLVK